MEVDEEAADLTDEPVQFGAVLNRSLEGASVSGDTTKWPSVQKETSGIAALRRFAWVQYQKDLSNEIARIGQSVTAATFSALEEFQEATAAEWHAAVVENGGKLPPRLQVAVPTALLHTGDSSGDHSALLDKLKIHLRQDAGAFNVVLIGADALRKAGEPKGGVGVLYRAMLQQMGAKEDDPVFPLNGKGSPCAETVCNWYLERATQRAAGRSPAPRGGAPSAAAGGGGAKGAVNFFAAAGSAAASSAAAAAAVAQQKGKGIASPPRSGPGAAGGRQQAAVKPFVVIVESSESAEAARPLESLIIKLSQDFLPRVPTLLVLGLSTSTAVLQERLPTIVPARLRARLFQIPPAVRRLERIEREVLLRSAFSPTLDGEAVEAIHSWFLERDMSFKCLHNTMEAAAFLHFSTNPLSFLSFPLQAAAATARANRGKPVFLTAVRTTLKSHVANQIERKDKAAVAFACKELGIKGAGKAAPTAEALSDFLWAAWVARERWAAALLCLTEAIAAADAAAEAAGKRPIDEGSFREVFRDASRPGFLAGSKAPGRRLLEAVSKGLKTAHAWPRLAALAETIRAALAEAPEMGAEAARAKEAAEAIERLSGADAEPADEPAVEGSGEAEERAALEAQLQKAAQGGKAAARKKMLETIAKTAQAKGAAASSGLGARQLAAAERVVGLVRDLAEAHLGKAPEEHPGSQACCFRATDKLEAMVQSNQRDVLRPAMRGCVHGCGCCPEGLALSPTVPPVAAFWRMMQSRPEMVSACDLIQEWAEAHAAATGGAGPSGSGAAAGAAAAGTEARGKKRGRQARKAGAPAGLQELDKEQRDNVVATFTRGMVDLQMLGYVRRPSAVGGRRGAAKASRLQRLIFEAGQQRAAVRTGTLSRLGGGAAEGDDDDEDEDEDDDDLQELAARMGVE